MKISSIQNFKADASQYSKYKKFNQSQVSTTFGASPKSLNSLPKKQNSFNIFSKVKGWFAKKPKVAEPPKNPEVQKVELTPTQAFSARIMLKYGIATNFDECLNVAECSEKSLDIMSIVFGKDFLPDVITYDVIPDDPIPLGCHFPYQGKSYVTFNKLMHDGFFKSKYLMNSVSDALDAKDKISKSKNPLHIKASSTNHPYGVFIHEFAHSAHYKNILKNSCGNLDKANMKWAFLRDGEIPSFIGRFITKFKLGDYSTTNFCEFMAERIMQDVCKYTNKDGEYFNNTEIINYSNIFDRKWNCKFTSPQSYLDNYTQRIWEGDYAKIKEAGDRIQVYLEKVEKKEAELKQRTALGTYDFVIGKIRDFGMEIVDIFTFPALKNKNRHKL